MASPGEPAAAAAAPETSAVAPRPPAADPGPSAPGPAPQGTQPLLMREGVSVILDVNGEKMSFAVLTPSQRVKVGKGFCSLAPLLGHPFGSTFELTTDAQGRPNLARLTAPPVQDQDPGPAADAAGANQSAPAGEPGADASEEPSSGPRDNRSLVDNNQAQALTAGDILELRKQGATGKAIVDALVTNSETFNTKTAFSQEKYKKKKQKKHAPNLTARLPTPHLVCETYFSKSPARIGFLRSDTLAMVLSASNIHAGCHALIVDECGGLLVASAAARMQGTGSICSLAVGRSQPSVDIVRFMNLTPEASSIIHSATLDRMLEEPKAVPTSPTKAEAHAQAHAPSEPESPSGPEAREGQGVAQGSSTPGGPPPDSATGAVASRGGVDGADASVEAGAGAADASTGAHDITADASMGAGDGTADAIMTEGDGTGNGSTEAKDTAAGGAAVEASEGAQADDGPVAPNTTADTPLAPKSTGDDGTLAPTTGDVDDSSTGQAQQNGGYQDNDSKRDRKRKRKEERKGGGLSAAVRQASDQQVQMWQKRGFTSLILVAPDKDPGPILMQLLPLMQPSSPFVVYHTAPQPLGELMRDLRGQALAMQLCEPWSREYQVLPQRTHPHMQMSATGGYFLHGTIVAMDEY